MNAVCAKFAHTAAGKTCQANYYNFDVIIAVGYRNILTEGEQAENAVVKEDLTTASGDNEPADSRITRAQKENFTWEKL